MTTIHYPYALTSSPLSPQPTAQGPRWLLHTCHCVTTPCACGRRNHSLTDALAPEDRQALLDPEDGETIAHERNEHVVVDAQPQDMEREGRKMKVGTGGTKVNGYGTSKGDKR